MRLAHYNGYAENILGPGRRAVVYFAGCRKRCPGCIAESWQKEDSGTSIDTRGFASLLIDDIRRYNLTGVTFSGGEPLLQVQDVLFLMREIKKETGRDDFLLFTGYTEAEIEEYLPEEEKKELYQLVSCMVTGPFRRKETDSNDPWRNLRGSVNQNIFLNKNQKKNGMQYIDNRRKERKFDVLSIAEDLVFTGIPG